MKESVSNGNLVTPMLFPYEPEQYWRQVRQIIREEVNNAEKQKPVSPNYETPGLTYKPLYKIAEVCILFHVTKPTIYDWVKHGKLNPLKSGRGCIFCGRIFSSFCSQGVSNSQYFSFHPHVNNEPVSYEDTIMCPGPTN